jgi:hypothetical protein
MSSFLNDSLPNLARRSPLLLSLRARLVRRDPRLVEQIPMNLSQHVKIFVQIPNELP